MQQQLELSLEWYREPAEPYRCPRCGRLVPDDYVACKVCAERAFEREQRQHEESRCPF